MAYLNFDTPPHAGGEAGAPRTRRPTRGRQGMLLTACLILGMLALIFTLAFVAVGEPIVAGLVTVLLLLPAASLIGGKR